MGINNVRERFRHLPQVLSHVEELPHDLLELFKTKVRIKTGINLIIYIPPQRFLKRFIGSRFVPEQALLFSENMVLQIQAKNEKEHEGTVKTIKAGNISYIRMELLLLYGKIDIFQSQNGNIDSTIDSGELISAEYNTTSFYMIKPGLRELIKNTWKNGKNDKYLNKQSTNKNIESEDFKKLPFKVKSGMRYYALHPEEYIQNMIFQPEIRRFRIKLIPKTLITFTNRQIIVLEDILSSPYGWIITYFQKSSNISFDLNRGNSIVSLLDMNFKKSKKEEKIQLRFEEENALKFLEFWDALK
jgi:hypothetical protein